MGAILPKSPHLFGLFPFGRCRFCKRSPYIEGSDVRRFCEDVDALQGYDRVWFIFSDIVDCGGCEGGIQQYYVDYLNGFGTLLDSSYASGANAYLYAMKP